MEKIIMQRGMGKTTELILRSAELQIPILGNRDDLLEQKALRMGVQNMPKPISLQSLRRGDLIGPVLVDDAEYVLQALLLREYGAEVVAMALSPDD